MPIHAAPTSPRDPPNGRGATRGELLIDRQLPEFDTALVCSLEVRAPPSAVYAAIARTDLLDPVVAGLFAVRELPARVATWLRGAPQPAAPRSVTFGKLVRPGSGMTVIAESPGREVVIGSVGQFWRGDYGHREVAAGDFAAFREPGYAKLAMSLATLALPGGGTLLRYEARTATTDAVARRRFAWYWRLIRPGVALVMRRALRLIRAEAESSPRRAAPTAA